MFNQPDFPVDLGAVGQLLDPACLWVDPDPRHVSVQRQVRPAREHRGRARRHRHVRGWRLDRLLPREDGQVQEARRHAAVGLARAEVHAGVVEGGRRDPEMRCFFAR